MPLFSDLFVKEHLIGAITFAVIALFSNKLAAKNGFFKLPPESERKIPIRLVHVLTVFFLYLSISLFIIPLLAKGILLNTAEMALSFKEIARLQLLSLLMSLITLSAYLFAFNRQAISRMWKDSEFSQTKIRKDIGIGVITWFISFPLVVCISQLMELFLYIFLGVQSYEQVAVRFLKMALNHPNTLLIAIFTVLIGAPLIEEILFRGFLQTWLKNRLGRKAGITLSSLAFAFFHIAPSQGYGNLALLFSLFIFGLYLGFVYERQRSLIAPMVLHAMFNLVSALRILTLME